MMHLIPAEGPGMARPQDLPKLIHLWSLCFQENEADSAYFLTRRFCPEQTFVWRREGKVCSVIYLIPVQGGSCRGGYLYAIGTHPDLQGQRIFTRLHRYVTEQAIAAGLDFLCLIPANPALFSLYGRLGYANWYGRRKYAMNDFPAKPFSLTWESPSMTSCTPEEYLSFMKTGQTVSAVSPDILLPAARKVRPPVSDVSALDCEAEADLLLVLQQYLHYEGFLIRCTIGTVSFVLAYTVEGHTLYLSQCSCHDPDILLQTAAFLTRQYDCRQCYLPPAAFGESSSSPYAMGLWLSPAQVMELPPLLGLMFT